MGLRRVIPIPALSFLLPAVRFSQISAFLPSELYQCMQNRHYTCRICLFLPFQLHIRFTRKIKTDMISLGFHLDMNGIQLLHLGDTYLTQQLIKDLLTLPAPHIFFPPINGQDYFRTARNCIGNLNFNEAAQLAGILHADLTVPTHFDMFFGNTADPLEFARTFMQYNSSAKWHIPSLGERFIYRR